jgi:hypothetical protein
MRLQTSTILASLLVASAGMALEGNLNAATAFDADQLTENTTQVYVNNNSRRVRHRGSGRRDFVRHILNIDTNPNF